MSGLVENSVITYLTGPFWQFGLFLCSLGYWVNQFAGEGFFWNWAISGTFWAQVFWVVYVLYSMRKAIQWWSLDFD